MERIKKKIQEQGPTQVHNRTACIKLCGAREPTPGSPDSRVYVCKKKKPKQLLEHPEKHNERGQDGKFIKASPKTEEEIARLHLQNFSEGGTST